MAKSKAIIGTARIQIKYKCEYIQAGEKFEVAKEDIEEIKKYADIAEGDEGDK